MRKYSLQEKLFLDKSKGSKIMGKGRAMFRLYQGQNLVRIGLAYFQGQGWVRVKVRIGLGLGLVQAQGLV